MNDIDADEMVKELLEPLKDVELEPATDMTEKLGEVAPLAGRRPDAPPPRARLGTIFASVLNLLSGLFARRPSEIHEDKPR